MEIEILEDCPTDEETLLIGFVLTAGLSEGSDGTAIVKKDATTS